MKKPIAKTDAALPEGIEAGDLEYPRHMSPDPLANDEANHGSFELYETIGFGWCISTLLISRASGRRTAPASDRTYAVRVADGATVRIGLGPHVKRTVTVYVRRSRVAALKRYLDLFRSGAERANTIRDRISSRRAQGVEMRAQGRSSWRWDV
jgi:hypothetical protein